MSLVASILISALALGNAGYNQNIDYLSAFNPISSTLNAPEDYEDYIEDAISHNKITRFSSVFILTPGMGGGFEHWIKSDGSSGNYIIDEDTLPYQLCVNSSRVNNIGFPINSNNINLLVLNSGNSRQIKRLSLDSQSNSYYIETNNLMSFTTTDVDTQIVIMYNGFMGGDGYNSINGYPTTDIDIYEDFKDSVNRVIVGIAAKQHGYLPKINLIGHSRGGLINLLYAHDYPEIVNNLISLGTPYGGSDWANVLVSAKKLINPSDDSYDDMLSNTHPSLYSSYIEDINNSVNTFAIGFNQTQLYFHHSINTFAQQTINQLTSIDELAYAFYLLSGETISYDFWRYFADALLDAIADYTINSPSLQSMLFASALFTAYNLSPNNSAFTSIASILLNIANILYTDVKTSNNAVYINSDIAVNTDSQIGYYRDSAIAQYAFGQRLTITLGDLNNNNYYDENHCSAPDLAWVAHNFECKSPTAINAIINYLNVHNGFHEHDYGVTSNSTQHKLMCSCLAQSPYENHGQIIQQYNNDNHILHCGVCSFFVTEPHNCLYVNNLDGTHTKTCSECGYINTENHVFNRYRSISDDYHEVYCGCGEVLGIAFHIYHQGKCVCGKRNHEYADPFFPPIINPNLPPWFDPNP